MALAFFVTSLDIGGDREISLDRLLIWTAFFVGNLHKVVSSSDVVAILCVVYSKIFVISSV